MLKKALILPLLCSALGACAQVDHGFGETVRLNAAMQTINPEGVEPTPGGPIEGGNGVRADGAVDRYERGAVRQPAAQSGGGSAGGGAAQ